MSSRYVDELRISPHAEEQLGQRGITHDEVLEVAWNQPAFFRDKVRGRDLMIGPTDGGEILLTFVIEPTETKGAWDVITGWLSGEGEKTRWRKAVK